MCEPIALPGRRSWAPPTPIRHVLRVAIGEGLTGWVAAHGETGPARRRDGGSAGARRPVDRWAGVDAARPDALRRHASTASSSSRRTGRDQFDADDETTLTIFAGYAAQALVNGTNMERLRRQQDELEHQLEGQRRLLEVNERLLSTLEPAGVLDLIADSLQGDRARTTR